MTHEKETPGHADIVPGVTPTECSQISTKPNPVQQARLLIAQGFRVLPVGPDKVPLVEGFGADNPDFCCGPEWFGEPGTAVGVLCGPCPGAPPGYWLVCVDVDGDPTTCPELAEWLANLPPTLSSHGGRHLWFWAPPGTAGGPAFKRAGVAHDGLDLKSAGGYARELWTWTDSPIPESVSILPQQSLDWLDQHRGASRRAAPAAAVDAPATEGRGEAFLRAHGFDPAVVREDAVRWLQQQAPLPTDGTGGATLMVVFGALLVGFGLDDDVALDLVCDVYTPRAWPGEDPDEAGFCHKIDEIDRHGSTTFVHMQLAMAARNARRARELGEQVAAMRAAAIEAAGGIEHPEEDHSGCKLCPRTGWPWILQRDRRYWLHKIDTAEYHPEISASELVAAVHRRLPNQVLFDGRKDLEEAYIHPVTNLTADYLTKSNVYDPATDTLSLALLRWMEPERATFHSHIDMWLRALAGPRYDALAQWLVSCTALDRPAPCLYLAGAGNLGKTLLMNGLASLWGVGKPGKLREVISDFNECLRECPLVFGDEGLPSNISFDWFRESITEYSQRLNLKGLNKFGVRGCARYAIAANNLEGFRYLKVGNLTKEDLRAIAGRLLVIECQPEAEAAWKTFNTHRAAQADIAEHVLWLAQSGTAAVTGADERMASRAAGGDLLMASVLVGRYSDILTVLRANLDSDTDDTQGRDPLVVRPPDAPGELWVSVPRLHARLQQVSGNKTSLADVRAFCKSHELRPAEQHKVGGVNYMMRVLSADSVEASIRELD